MRGREELKLGLMFPAGGPGRKMIPFIERPLIKYQEQAEELVDREQMLQDLGMLSLVPVGSWRQKRWSLEEKSGLGRDL